MVMAELIWETSKTFNEFLLIPNLTTREHTVANTSLKTPLARFRSGERPRLELNLPLVSAVMQAVSNDTLAIALARCGGLSFIFHSQPIEQQAAMVRKVKSYKAGFVESDSNLPPNATLADARALTGATGHSTIAITNDGTANGVLLGLLTRRDYPRNTDAPEADTASDRDPVANWMTPIARLKSAPTDVLLEVVGDLIWSSKQDCVPVTDSEGRLQYLVFRKDFESLQDFPLELVDNHRRLKVGAGINSHDFMERVPALLAAGADAFCLDSSDGYSEYQADAIKSLKQNFGPDIVVGAGNVVDARGFRFLAESGADFVKVGIGGGSICITREQKGIGRGQASALLDVAAERDRYFAETGEFIPICSDGGILYDYQIAIALAMGAQCVMLGRYFARFDQSPGARLKRGSRFVKEYWAEGSDRAKNWARYDLGGKKGLLFAEGVDGYVPYAGDLIENVSQTSAKVRSTMCNCGAITLDEFSARARIVNVSQQSFTEGAYTIDQWDQEES